ncbi:hypothetical protein H112_04476 [Trichophyton rubrum D6]|uniref:Uncharacterized protein n=1 Tax=Trichophyton rubrum CBS 288.86 TaxID=1215330 RepID=A0A022W223_TRIRU|nr:hypothetical protein H102_04469 [Trichophyton rubrum CBS 100081]EZF52412.1 hypothetical protein H103_04481 [Trichophyton rubrum CBS 288.86]EZF95203.1 hypothetical protein H113_04512 [Trichophyton rubrum MR1459]EZG06108.1 hypothetical protein H106_04294 [Trichophyton rubrum CBS 735.88]KDB33612.1 hypothetical protein H112_04476 [Trichophyton rubrum D6]
MTHIVPTQLNLEISLKITTECEKLDWEALSMIRFAFACDMRGVWVYEGTSVAVRKADSRTRVSLRSLSHVGAVPKCIGSPSHGLQCSSPNFDNFFLENPEGLAILII